MMRFAMCAILLATFLSLAACTADWPHFRGPNADGIAPETGINKDWLTRPPKRLWLTAMSDNGFAGPCVADGKVFIIDHQNGKDVIRALDFTTGKELWTFVYQDMQVSNYGFSQSTPTVDNGKLYTVSRMGQVFCLNAGTGEKIWSCDMVAELGCRLPPWQIATSPLIDGEKLILCPGSPNGTVAALEKSTGKLLWRGGGSEPTGYATPVIATINGTKQYVVVSEASLNGVDAGTGKLLWTFPWRTDMNVNAASPVIDNNLVFITSAYDHGCALIEITPQGPVKRWENTNMQSTFTTPILANGFLYGTSDPGKLVCLEMKTGDVRWSQSGFEKGGLIGVEGTLLVFEGARGNLVMVKITPDGYQELGRYKPLGGQSWTSPIIADGKLVVRNPGLLACYNMH